MKVPFALFACMISQLWAPPRAEIRLRGGWRQRQAAQRLADEPQASSMSCLAGGQLLLWADGVISAAQLQRTMADAVADGLVHPMVKRLAQLPPGGRANAALVRLLITQTSLVDRLSALDNGPIHNMILPSELINTLCTMYPEEFKRCFGAEENL
eukprot:2061982-Pyramimonas_sp.AAC.1